MGPRSWKRPRKSLPTRRLQLYRSSYQKKNLGYPKVILRKKCFCVKKVTKLPALAVFRQKQTISIFTKSRYSEHTGPLCKKAKIIAIMELDWYCTGLLGMKQQSCWGVLWFFKSPQVSPLEKQRNWQHEIWYLRTNTQANRVKIVSSVITKIFNLCKYWMVTTQPSVYIFSAYLHLLPVFCYCSSVVWFSLISVLFYSTPFVRLFSVRLLVYSVYFLSWYWNCIPAILIPITTTIQQFVNKHHTSDSAILP